MGNGPVVIKYSEILKILKNFPMDEVNDSKLIKYVRTDDEDKDKTEFLKTLLRIIHGNARSNVKDNSKYYFKEFEKIFDSVAESLWERIQYENVNFFVNDVKANVYETALNMFMKQCFEIFSSIKSNGDRYNIDSILVKLVDTDGTIKVCNLNKLFENVYIPTKIYDTFITFENDCLPSVSYPYVFFPKIYRFFKYFELNQMIVDHICFMNFKRDKYHEAFEKILMRNNIFMTSFGIEYSRFSKQLMGQICAINAKYPNYRRSIADEILPILMNKDSHVGDLGDCDFARDVVMLLSKAKSMSAPNLDSRCDTLCENLEELENSYLNTFNKLFELKEKVFEPLEYNDNAIDSIFSTMISGDKFCLPEHESYAKILDECISEVEIVYQTIVSELERWCSAKIDDKVNYGYNYDAQRDFSEYFCNRKYVNTDSFVKFTNPAVFNLI